MKIISVLGAKGGTGKSTLSLILAASLSKKGKVALLDCDIQLTCVSAKKVNPDLPYEVVSTPLLKDVLSEGERLESEGVDWIIIDTNPRSFLEDPKRTKKIIQLSDLCLLPCRPAPRDIRATLELSERIVAEKANARIVWTFVQPRVRAHKESIKQAPALLGIKPLKTVIKQRICYQDVFDEPPLPIWNLDAKNELRKLIKEVIKLTS
ncbi:MAG: Iron-sulfur cluster carrier protein [Chlamydiae bacterium]|nr:Iron-sulfur cluster carrier protein [Chlamydiota bacterium]